MKLALDDFLLPYRREYEDMVARMSELVAEMRRTMAVEARGNFPVLAQHGWYPDLELSPQVEREVARLFESGRGREADAALFDYYNRRLSKIAKALIEQFPARARVLRSAFWAHRQRRYYLSVPVFLAQADGICLDKLGAQLFKKRNKRPATAAVIESAGDFWSAMLSPLTMIAPISVPAEVRATLPARVLNRHAVLHGESSDYGTRINSCKAISLLNYVGTVLPFFESTPRIAAL